MSDFAININDMNAQITQLRGQSTALFLQKSLISYEIMKLRANGNSTTASIKQRLGYEQRRLTKEINNIYAIINAGSQIVSEVKNADKNSKAVFDYSVINGELPTDMINNVISGLLSGYSFDDEIKAKIKLLGIFGNAGGIASGLLGLIYKCATGKAGPGDWFGGIGGIFSKGIPAIADFHDKGWKEGLKSFFGWSAKTGSGKVNATTWWGRFKEGFKMAGKEEIGKYNPSGKTGGQAAKTVGKWLGVVVEAGTEFFENKEEFKNAKTAAERRRMWGETAIETAVDVGKGMAANAAVAAIWTAAAGTAPVSAGASFAVAAIATVAVVGVDWVSKKLTGKDIGEHVSDFVYDKVIPAAKDVGKAIGNGIKTVGDGVKKVGEAIGNGVSNFGKSVCGWAKGLLGIA